jgi:O-antigen/teichoic acid export membrane protein
MASADHRSNRRLFKNISASWIGLGTDALTGVLLTPFILHRIGATAFGVWVLVSAFGGYYGLLDFGTRNAIVQYVARYNAQGDRVGLRKSISSAVAGYMLVAVVALIATVVLAANAEQIFKIDPEFVRSAKTLILVFGIGTAVGFPLSVFGGILEGLQQFTTVGVVQAIESATRAVLICVLLRAGGTVVTLAVITIGSNVVAGLTYAWITHRKLPYVRIAPADVNMGSLRQLTSFGLITFWVGVADRLRFQSDSLVIGTIIDVAQVAVFAIAARMVMYATEIVGTMAGVFTPMLTDAHARGANSELLAALRKGNMYLVHLWVGSGYDLSATIMIVVGTPMCLYFAQSASTRALYAVAKHRFLAKMLLYEGLANLAISIALAPKYGLIGVAVGTAVPLLATSAIVLPIHTCRTLGVGIRDYVAAFGAPALAVIPLSMFWVFTYSIHASTHGVGAALVKLAAGGAIYMIAIWLTFRLPVRRLIDPRIPTRS